MAERSTRKTCLGPATGRPPGGLSTGPNHDNADRRSGNILALQGEQMKANAETALRQRRGGRAASDCPVVKYNEKNADIDYVINCPGIAMPGIQ
jgi:hypothetical protein